MKVYTKTGDKGQTGLIGGTRVEKNDVRLEAYGTVDELNSHIGMLISMNLPQESAAFLQEIQKNLFVIGSHLATDTTKTDYNPASVMQEEYILKAEAEIDKLEENLPGLTRFILPGGSPEAAQCHICRTVARRAERRIVEMSKQYQIDDRVIVYVNRLSDYLFVLSRFVIKWQGKQEIYWK